MSTHGKLLKVFMPPQYSLFWNHEKLPTCVRRCYFILLL